jgi:hypothetical protein
MKEEACSRVSYRGHAMGELRAGRTVFGPYTPDRGDNRLGFNKYLALYFSFGLDLCVPGAARNGRPRAITEMLMTSPGAAPARGDACQAETR